MERRKFILLSGFAASITVAGCVDESGTEQDDVGSGEDDSSDSDESDSTNNVETDVEASINKITFSHEPSGVRIEPDVITDEVRYYNVLRDDSGSELDREIADNPFINIPERIVRNGGTLIFEIEADDTVIDSREIKIEGYQLKVEELIIEASESHRGEEDEYSIDEIKLTVINEGDLSIDINGIEINVGGRDLRAFGRISEYHEPGREYTYTESIINETLRTGTYTATVTVEAYPFDSVGTDEAQVKIE